MKGNITSADTSVAKSDPKLKISVRKILLK